ncbi:hypothetical protein C8T65DRAFT_744640 [Cerioporus squamosus]|nr:hypothetical protein C8T65DRAFT_744640 [Cerioporus squamosus]
MASNSTGDDVERLKSTVRVYEDLVKEQAGEIAALKAENVYLKQQLEPHHQNTSISAAASSAQRQASGPESGATPVVKRTDSPPPSVAGSSNDPYIIDDDEEIEAATVKPPETPPPRRADRLSTEAHRSERGHHQVKSTKSLTRSREKLPKKRRSSPAAGPSGQYFPEYEPSAYSLPRQDDSPRKKPKLVPEVVIPRFNHAKYRAHRAHQIEPPPAPVIEDDPVAGPANDLGMSDNELVPGTTNTQDDLYASENDQVVGPMNTQDDLDPFENNQVARPSNTQHDFDDEWDMSSLSSLPSTPSRPSSPANDELNEDRARDDTTLLLRSASRELSYHDPPVEHERNARLGQASRPSTSRARLSRLALQVIAAPISGRDAAVKSGRLAGLVPYNVALSDPSLSRVPVNRKQMGNIYGGSLMRMCVRTAGRDFLFPGLDMNPFLPRAAGTPGLLIRSNDALPWKGDVQTVFVGLRPGEYVYCGQYRLQRTEALSAAEYRALSSKVKRKWAAGLVNKPKFKDVRVRVATRRDHGREPTFQEIAAVVADRSDAYKGHVSEQDIIRAYERGEERLLMWKMECVGYDEEFLKELVSKL